MLKNINTRRILQDLYEADPSLRSHQKTLLTLIEEMLKAKPDAEADPEFEMLLRARLLERAGRLSKGKTDISEIPGVEIHMNKYYYMAAGAFVFALILLPAVLFIGRPDGKTAKVDNQAESPKQAEPLFRNVINKVQENAFGKLSFKNVQQNNDKAALGMGGGGNNVNPAPAAAVRSNTESAAAIDLSSSVISSKMVPPFEMTNYKYVYNGNALDLTNQQAEVYKRVKGSAARSELDRALSSVNFGMIDLSTFDGRLQNFNLIEDQDFGYSIFVNLDEGQISLSENWLKWKRPDSACTDQACFDRYRLSMQDVPDDNSLIEIARNFLTAHNIDIAGYGEPMVQNDWKNDYNRTPDKNNYYIPEAIGVIFPLKLNGQEVYNESGGRVGLTVNVNIREKKVSGLYDLSTQQYDSSSYAMETDQSKIMKIVERGGVFGYSNPVAKKTLEITLGDPVLGLMKIYKYENNATSELLVPAYIFPIVDTPDGAMVWQKNVAVPLAKDILEEYSVQPPIMPLLEKAVQ